MKNQNTTLSILSFAGDQFVRITAMAEPGIGIHLVGLPDTAVKESFLRVSTAMFSLGYRLPGQKIVINVSPACRSCSSELDLALALVLVSLAKGLNIPDGKILASGEMNLDGTVCGKIDADNLRELAWALEIPLVVVPKSCVSTSGNDTRVNILGVRTLAEAINHIKTSHR